MPSTTNDEPYIIYDSVMEDATPTVGQGTLTAGAVTNLTNRITVTTASFDASPWTGGTDIHIKHDAGVGETVIVDSFALSGHVIHGAAGSVGGETFTVRLAYSSDDITYTTATAVVVYTDRTVVKSWNNSSGYRYWRWEFDGSAMSTTGDIKLSVLAMGERLDLGEYMASGFDPSRYRTKMDQSRSNTGTFLGTSVAYIEQALSLKITQAGVAKSFVFDDDLSDANFALQARHAYLPSLDHYLASTYLAGKPHWFSWRNSDKAISSVIDRAGHEGQFYVLPSSRGRFSSPFMTGVRRGIRLDWDVLVEGMFDHVKAYG